MNKLAVKPKVDLAFKKIFSENHDLLKSLLAAVLDIEPSEIQEMKLENTEILPEDINKKFCRLDLKIKMRGRYVDVEVQLNDHGDFQSRALYYWARLFSEALGSGQDYNVLPETIVISFVNFSLFGCSEYHSNFVLKEKTRNEILTDKLSLHFFELKKIPKEIDEDKKIEWWLKLISAETYEDLSYLETTKNQDIKTALDFVGKLNADEIFKKQIEMREDTLRNEHSALNWARRKGHEQMIAAMKANGMSDEEIEKIVRSMPQ
jgi:predicted transposase/invertase (TIGR01784 family)